eukprot:3294074-Alexandrium_andersonii.AAC.1
MARCWLDMARQQRRRAERTFWQSLGRGTTQSRKLSGASGKHRGSPISADSGALGPNSVSYTHLTLPTICSV